jgi:hypothetical protein
MNEPKRLLVSGSPVARGLLSAGKKDAPSPVLATTVMATLGVATTTSFIAPSLGAKLLAALRHVAFTKLSASVLVVTAAGTGYVAGRMHEHALESTHTQVTPVPTAAEAATPKPKTKPTTATAQATAPVTATVAATATVTAAATVPATAIAVPSTEAVAPPTPTVQPSLVEELDSIRRARALVLQSSGRQALRELDSYDSLHPNGTFAEEALALRVRAARLTGDTIAAQNALQKLESRFPNSVHLTALTAPAHP